MPMKRFLYFWCGEDITAFFSVFLKKGGDVVLDACMLFDLHLFDIKEHAIYGCHMAFVLSMLGEIACSASLGANWSINLQVAILAFLRTICFKVLKAPVEK